MYLGIDVGGTKTLVATLDEQGSITEDAKFPTPPNYQVFLEKLGAVLQGFQAKQFRAGCIAIPGRIDRKRGIGLKFGNLPWQNVPAKADAENLTGCPFQIENDAKLAGLSEALLLKDKYRKVLYVTMSTGIGVSLIVDGTIDAEVGDGGGRSLLLEHEGKIMPWEEFAGGKAIFERYGKKAAEITDQKSWQIISQDLAQGLIHFISITEPEVVVIGGSVGTYFDRYGLLLEAELEKYPLAMIDLPKIVGAKHPTEAVIYGCYDLAKQVYG